MNRSAIVVEEGLLERILLRSTLREGKHQRDVKDNGVLLTMLQNGMHTVYTARVNVRRVQGVHRGAGVQWISNKTTGGAD